MSFNIERDLEFGMNSINVFFNGTTALCDVIGEILSYLDKDPTAKILNKHIKNGGELDFITCRSEYKDEIHSHLKDAGIRVLHTNAAAYGGVDLFVFADSDAKKVEIALNKFRAEHEKAGIIDKSLFDAYSGGKARCISGLDVPHAMLIVEHAENRGIKLIVDEPRKGEFNITYAEKDKGKMDRIKKEVVIELSGIGGKALKKQLEYENKNVVKLLNEMQTHNKKEPFHIVDLHNRELRVTEYEIRYEGPEGVITVDRSEKDFMERSNELLQRMEGPIRLSELQKREFDTVVDKKNFLVKAEKENGRPSYTKDEYLAIRNMMENKYLYEVKLSLLNPEQQKYDICIENNDMRLATFEEYNDLNEEEIERGVDEDILDDINRELHNFKEERLRPGSFGSRFEEEVLDGLHLDKEYMDMERDISHDMNANFMPDEYEQ